VLLLESMAHSRKFKSSLKNKNQNLDLRERGRGTQILDLNECFYFLSGHPKRAVGESFHQTSPMAHITSPAKLSRSWSRPEESLEVSHRPDMSDQLDKSGGTL
jgi:hypothetical protein